MKTIGHKLLRVGEVINKNHVADSKFVFKYTRWFLTFMGVWPYVGSRPTLMDRYLWKYILPLPTFMVLLWTVPLLCHVVLRELTSLDIIACVGPISYHITCITNNFILVSRRDSIRYCFQHMEADWQRVDNESDRELMRQSVKAGHWLSFISLICMYSSATFFNALPLVTGRYVNEFNETVRPLTFPGADIFFDLEAGYNYEIIFCVNWASAMALHNLVMTVCDLCATFMSHACGQIQIVVSRLESLAGAEEEECNVDIITNRIAYIVETHVRTLGFTTRINKILQEICLLEVGLSTLMICWLEFYGMLALKHNNVYGMITYFLVLISTGFNIFMFCHIGEVLKEQFEQIGRAAYMMEWYRLPGKSGLALLMLIGVTKNPPKLTAGQMMDLSYYSFGSIIQTSFAYFNLMRQVSD